MHHYRIDHECNIWDSSGTGEGIASRIRYPCIIESAEAGFKTIADNGDEAEQLVRRHCAAPGVVVYRIRTLVDFFHRCRGLSVKDLSTRGKHDPAIYSWAF